MKRNYAGCAICDSTWGNLWEEVDGERMFFCCPICVVQFRGLVDRIKQETGWAAIDSVEIRGDRRGRVCDARRASEGVRVRVMFNPEGEILRFERLDPSVP